MTSGADRLSGVLSPVVTPFDENLDPDPALLIRQCRWLLSQGVGLAVFGTNSEANSLSVAEKRTLIDHLVEGGIDPGRMMPGTGCCALSDSVELTRHAVERGCAGTLMLPPFYYKGVSDDGLFASFAEIIERVADDRLRIYLYHIPPIAQVGIPVELVERLVQAYPDTIVGIKDSSGDWENSLALLRLGLEDFRVFVGSEGFLLRNMQNGGAGCISATANINPAAIERLWRHWQDDDAEQQQAALDDIRERVLQFPMIPALKSVVAHFSDEAGWRRVRPPLMPLDDRQRAELVESLRQAEFRMPGLAND
jgi:4-hydroxy-tetrahydrodipicolinate synthase